MNEALRPIRLATPPLPVQHATRHGGRGKPAPFVLDEEPRAEAEGAADVAPRKHACDGREVGQRLDDELGRTVDVTV